ncbi:hypothetical protein KZ483_23850 [Paenibacillus sp. sptzw28]|uniref:hypothetical protein n=1 Tax=Paenibacillus sp. sptzw28 TaxID=715179 RepID=UPI001C6E35CA|nr:hypothetical protein [Paenibacillus sp. sptzw28]QYR20758.1 hypothetical protein KZ483_23850 [Paenibacillus sp. sptzw28]
MKRYTLTILLGLFIAAGIGTYYVYGAVDNLPRYKLSTIQGNTEEGAALELSGNYSGRMRSQSLTVTTDGARYSRYYGDHSILRQNFLGALLNARSYFYRSSDIRDLIKNHRNFMRGKGLQGGFYKDEEWLIYAHSSVKIVNSTKRKGILIIDLLNLSSGKTKRYETAANTVYIQEISDVQRVGNQIHILSYEQKPNQTAGKFTESSSEYRDYVVDLNNGNLIRNEKLSYDISGKKGVQVNIRAVTNALPSAPAEYVLLTVDEEKITEKDHNSYTGVTIARHLYSYSYKTGHLTALPASLTQRNLGPKTYQSYSLNGNMIDLLAFENKKVSVSRYNLDIEQEEKVLPPITAKLLGADQLGNALIKNNRVYVLLHKNKIPMAAVLDATDGKLLYKGQVTFEGPDSEANEQMKNLQLLNMNIKN